MNALTPRTVNAAIPSPGEACLSETQIELGRLRDNIEGLDYTVSTLLERLQPITRQVQPQTTIEGGVDKPVTPESQLGIEIAKAADMIASITMRLRERNCLLAI
jgi:hypothetical protein